MTDFAKYRWKETALSIRKRADDAEKEAQQLPPQQKVICEALTDIGHYIADVCDAVAFEKGEYAAEIAAAKEAEKAAKKK